MKNLILLSCIALLSVSCIKIPNNVPRSWNIQNYTEQTLVFKCPYAVSSLNMAPERLLSKRFEYKEFELTPNAFIKICAGGVPRNNEPYFEYYFKMSAEKFGEDVSWQILSEDGVVLKVWRYSDKDLPDQRFFNEDWWDTPRGGWHSWTFDIIPEDIEPTE